METCSSDGKAACRDYLESVHVMLTEEDRARLENQDSGEDEQVTTTNVEDSDEESEKIIMSRHGLKQKLM